MAGLGARASRPHAGQRPAFPATRTNLSHTLHGGSSDGHGGAALLADPVRRFGLAERLADAVKVKSRNRGASAAETQLSVIASLAAGNGPPSDLDALREHGVQQEFLGCRRRRRAAGRGSSCRG